MASAAGRRRSSRSARSYGKNTRESRHSSFMPLQPIEENITARSRKQPVGSISPTTKFVFSDSENEGASELPHRRRSVRRSRRISTRKQRSSTAKENRLSVPYQTTKSYLESELDSLRRQVERKAEEIEETGRKQAEELKRTIQVEVKYLPDFILRMPVKVFMERYGGDLKAAVNAVCSAKKVEETQKSSAIDDLPYKADSKTEVENIPPQDQQQTRRRSARLSAKITTPSSRSRSSFHTPLNDIMPTPSQRTTMLRTARKGETVYSSRGSPVLPEAPASKNAAIDLPQPHAAQSKTLQWDGTSALELADLDRMSKEEVSEAQKRLESLQKRIERYWSTFSETSGK